MRDDDLSGGAVNDAIAWAGKEREGPSGSMSKAQGGEDMAELE